MESIVKKSLCIWYESVDTTTVVRHNHVLLYHAICHEYIINKSLSSWPADYMKCNSRPTARGAAASDGYHRRRSGGSRGNDKFVVCGKEILGKFRVHLSGILVLVEFTGKLQPI